MSKHYPVVGVCLASALFLALQARAENAVEKAEPTQSSVQDNVAPQTSGNVQQMEAITVTATRQRARVLDVPQTVNVITQKTIENHNVNNIEELIRHTPGVHVNRQVTPANGPFGNTGGFTIRGVGMNRILTTVDGDRVMEATLLNGNHGNRNFVDMATLKSVEIQRGPASVMWGADAMGGMVAYQTLDPDDMLVDGKQFAGKAAYNYDGLNNGNSESATFAGRFNDQLSALVSYTHREFHETELSRAKADGGRWGMCGRLGIGCDELNPTEAETNSLLAKLVYRPNQDHQFKLTGEVYNSDTDVHNIYNQGLSMTNDGRDYRNQEQSRYRFALEHQWDINLPAVDSIKWHISYSPQEREVTSKNAYTLMKMLNYSTKNYTDYEQDFYQGDIQLTSSFDLGPTSHKLTYGFQGDYTKTDYELEKTTTVNGVTTKTKGSQAKGNIFAAADTTRADLYLQDEIKLFDNRLTLTPGIRRAHFSLDPDPDKDYAVVSGFKPKKMSETEWLPQFGAIFKLTDVYSIYGRYAEGFKMPTAEQLYNHYDTGFASMMSTFARILPNPDLKPEEVKSYELGLRGEWDKGWFSIGGFYSDYDNFLRTKDKGMVDGQYTLQYENLSKVKLWGIEASGEWNFARNWTLSGSADWQYGKQKDKGDDDYVPFTGASPLTATIGLKWEQPQYGLTTELFGTFARGVKRTEEKDDFQPGGYSVFDGYVNWQINKYLKLNASVTNIFNRRYFDYTAATMDAKPASAAVAYTNPIELYTQPGRTFSVGLQASF